MGYATLGALAAAPVAGLQEAFGDRMGRFLHHRAHLRDDSPVETSRVVKSRSNETTFDTDIDDLGELESVLRRLAAGLAEGLAKCGAHGRTIAIKVRLDDWTTVTRARTISAPTNDAELITTVALELLRAYAPRRPVRLLGVRVASFGDPAEHEARAERRQLALPLEEARAG
jgi:DNA polymerase IV